MNVELEALETKIEQAVALIHQLRAENEVLRNQMVAAEAERLHLRQTMTAARERLEGLMDKIPEDAEMSAEPNFLDVKIMGREYRVACSPEEREALLAAVNLVDGKMRDIAQRTKNTIAERVAVMAALNIAHEHLSAAGDGSQKEFVEAVDTSETKRRIGDMGARLDAVLAPQQRLDI